MKRKTARLAITMLLIFAFCASCDNNTPENHEHIAGETVRERENVSTCIVAGGYDEVIYCETCGVTLSRTHVTLELVDHEYDPLTNLCICCGKSRFSLPSVDI